LGARASCVPVRSSLLLGARLRSARHRRRNKLSVVTHPHLRLEPSNFRAFYCSAALNRAVNGAANSAHLWGGAADFTVPGFGDPADVIRAITPHLGTHPAKAASGSAADAGQDG